MPDDFAQLVKAQADIVKIVGEHVRLRKAGAQNWTGLCPFHSEKSGSFSVHATKQFFHCFGCGVSGDVFTFVMRVESVSFPEAVRAVATKSGIPLPKREFGSPGEAAEHRERARLIELHEQASAFFEEQLRSPGGAGAREYLAGRGLTAEGIGKFRIGYAPDSSSALRMYLERLVQARLAVGEPPARTQPAPGAQLAQGEQDRSGELTRLLRLAGLFTSKEQEDASGAVVQGPLYPRFRKRITFPILNEAGRVIAFTARALEGGDKAGPKYLNSPETPLYSKGQVLFNLDKARTAIRQLAGQRSAQGSTQDFALLVEGQMDCITVSLAGIANVLATSGTAFTEAQVRLLGRYTKRVIVNFDPDTAGANAAEKSIALLTEEGFDVRVVTLEAGLDPDRFVRERGVGAYMAAVRGARRHSEYLLERARQMHPVGTAQGKIDALNYLLPHIRRMPSGISREEFASEAAHRLGIDSAMVREELKQAAAGRKQALGGMPELPLSNAEKYLIRVLAADRESAASLKICEALERHPEFFAGLPGEAVLRCLKDLEPGVSPMTVLPDAERRILAQVHVTEDRRVMGLNEVEEALRSLHCTALEREQRSFKAALAEAERVGDRERYVEIALKKQEVERLLREL